MNISKIKPRVFVLIGPPAAGKSTYRDDLVKTLNNPMVVSSDDLIEAFAKNENTTYDSVYGELDMKYLNSVLRDNIQYAVRHNHDIVIDRTNITPKARNRFLSLVPKNYKRIGVVFEFTVTGLIERIEKRNHTGKTIPMAVLEDFIDQYTEPTEDEFSEIIRINTFE